MQPPDSTPSAPDFLSIPGPFGHPVLVHRLQAEQAAASGMPVLLAIPADAVRLALAGPRQLTQTEQGILDTLRNVGAPMTAPELAALDEVAASLDHVKQLLRPDEHLRKSCGVKHQKGAGYFV